MKTKDKKPRRDKRRCVHFVGREEGFSEDHCSMCAGKVRWWSKCGGAHGCDCYEEREQEGAEE